MGDWRTRLQEALRREPDVEMAWLFGSRALGGGAPESDVDVAVWSSRALTAREELDLRARLAAAAGLPDVDLVLLEKATPLLRYEAVCGQRLVARDDALADDYEGRAAMTCFDTQHFRRVQQGLLRQATEARLGPEA